MLKNNIPQRRCIGCLQSVDQSELIRMTCREEGLEIDAEGKSPGRGFYIHFNESCINKALKKKAFPRVMGRNPSEEEMEKLISKVLEKGKEL